MEPKFAVNYKVNPSLSFKTSVGYGFKAPDFDIIFLILQTQWDIPVLGYNVAESQLNVLEKQGQLLNRIGIGFEIH
jgi:outer membrane receptor for ferrienterochelin and colicins